MKNAINTSINTEECIIHFWPSYLHFNLKKNEKVREEAVQKVNSFFVNNIFEGNTDCWINDCSNSRGGLDMRGYFVCIF